MENEKQGKEAQTHFVYRYATMRDCKYFLVFALDLPFSLPINKPFHEMIVNKLSFSPFKDEKRFVAFYSEQKWSDYTETPGREIVSARFSPGDPINGSVAYRSVLTALKIMIEVKSDEIDKVQKRFREKKFRTDLLVRIMSILEYKLIETFGFVFGAEHINYGAERVTLFVIDNDVDVIKPLDGLATSDYSAKRSLQLTQGTVDNMFCNDICVWRYFANKCENDYFNGKHLDCILSAAMAIESYIHFLLVKNGLLKTFHELLASRINTDVLIDRFKKGEIDEKEFVSLFIQQKKTKQYSDSVFSEVTFLCDQGVFDKKTRDQIKTAFGKINKNRNDIIHGNIESILIEQTAAEEAYQAILQLFSAIPFEEPKRRQEDFKSREEQMYNADALFRNNNHLEVLPILFDNLKRGIYVSISSYYLGIIYYNQKEFKIAKKLFLICYKKKRFLFQSVCYLAFIAHKVDNQSTFLSYKDEAIKLYEIAQKDIKRSSESLSFYQSFYNELIKME